MAYSVYDTCTIATATYTTSAPSDEYKSCIFACMSTKEKIGARIKEKRTEKGLSLSELAQKTKTLSKSRISNYEHARRTPGPDEIKELAAALGCSTSYLYCFDDDTKIEEESTNYESYRKELEIGKRVTSLPANLQNHVISVIQDAELLAGKTIKNKFPWQSGKNAAFDDLGKRKKTKKK